jgi:LEA14-like dessication related protein
LVAATLVASTLGCATLPLTERPEIQAVRPRISGIDFQGVNMAFDVDVRNPYPIPLRTPRFRYGIDVEGSRFFDSEAASGIDLPASGVGTATLPVRMSYADLWRTYGSLAGAPEADYTLRGALLIPVAGQSLELPLSHSGTFPILRPPAFSDVKVQLGDVSLTKAGVSVDAVMKNPNAFALGLEGLGYALKLGDAKLGGLSATTASTLAAGQTGRMTLSGDVSAASALFNMLMGGGKGGAEIVPSGSIQTPYGTVKLP